MVAFLEKHFEFTTPLSISECVDRLRDKSTRGYGLFASKRDIRVNIAQPSYGTSFDLNRDVGRSLYAEVFGEFSRENDITRVKGFGRMPLSIFIMFVWMCFISCFIMYALRNLDWIPLIFSTGIVMGVIFFIITLKNRDNLIKIVKQTLEANE